MKAPESLPDGTYIVGEYLGSSDGREWTDREGKVHHPVVVRVLTGAYVE